MRGLRFFLACAKWCLLKASSLSKIKRAKPPKLEPSLVKVLEDVVSDML